MTVLLTRAALDRIRIEISFDVMEGTNQSRVTIAKIKIFGVNKDLAKRKASRSELCAIYLDQFLR